MKAKLICTAILATAASFAQAQDLTAGCLAELAFEPRLATINDKVDRAGAPQRVVTAQEKDAVGLWAHLRQQCFEFGAAERRSDLPAHEAAFEHSLFVFQQRLVIDLRDGRLTYAEFNSRRAGLAHAAGRI